MSQPRISASFHLVCSDEPRNGKTLYARLISDYLILCDRAPLIFDATSGVSDYFLIRSYAVDLAIPTGQMALFDRALEPPLRDCVVDLPAHLLSRMAKLIHTIGFAEAARNHGLGVVVHFLVDRRLESLFAGRNLRSDVDPDRFIIVRNEALVPAFLEPAARRRYDDLAREGQVFIPALDARTVEEIEEETFSFSAFSRNPERVSYFKREPIMSLLARVFGQFDELGLTSQFVDMREKRKLRESLG
jgi:hypothetical protein